MSHIGFVHCRNTDNIGDIACGPEDYFAFGNYELAYLPMEEIWQETRMPVPCEYYIIGGGGMFFGWNRKHIFEYSQSRKVIIWGAGLNHENEHRNFDNYPSWIDGTFVAVGVRDYVSGLRWVPCVSCMSTLFDTPREPTCKYVVYDHDAYPLRLDTKAPRTTNQKMRTMSQALDFLAQGEVILTSSYHGAYWGLLLGRRVVVWPWSTKFLYMKYMPLLQKWDVPLSTWRVKDLVRKAPSHPGILEEHRQANLAYYNVVKKILKISS